MKDIFMRYFFVYFDLITEHACIVCTQNHVLLFILMLMFLLLLNKLCYVPTLNIQVHKNEILVKFNEDFHNRFAMQKCDVMFYFNRSAIFSLLKYNIFTPYTLISVCIFSILFSIQFLGY